MVGPPRRVQEADASCLGALAPSASSMKHFAIFVDVMSEVMGRFGANSLRAEEDLNGSLQLRLGESESDAKKEPDSLFRQCFCALSKNLFLVYSDDRSMMPLEIICLQYATVTANRDWSHAFQHRHPHRQNYDPRSR